MANNQNRAGRRNVGSGNTSAMSRGMFLKTTGIATAGVAATGLGLSGVAHAVGPASEHLPNPSANPDPTKIVLPDGTTPAGQRFATGYFDIPTINPSTGAPLSAGQTFYIDDDGPSGSRAQVIFTLVDTADNNANKQISRKVGGAFRTNAQIAAAIATVINAQSTLLVTASAAANRVSLTHKNSGSAGNNAAYSNLSGNEWYFSPATADPEIWLYPTNTTDLLKDQNNLPLINSTAGAGGYMTADSRNVQWAVNNVGGTAGNGTNRKVLLKNTGTPFNFPTDAPAVVFNVRIGPTYGCILSGETDPNDTGDTLPNGSPQFPNGKPLTIIEGGIALFSLNTTTDQTIILQNIRFNNPISHVAGCQPVYTTTSTSVPNNKLVIDNCIIHNLRHGSAATSSSVLPYTWTIGFWSWQVGGEYTVKNCDIEIPDEAPPWVYGLSNVGSNGVAVSGIGCPSGASVSPYARNVLMNITNNTIKINTTVYAYDAALTTPPTNMIGAGGTGINVFNNNGVTNISGNNLICKPRAITLINSSNVTVTGNTISFPSQIHYPSPYLPLPSGISLDYTLNRAIYISGHSFNNVIANNDASGFYATDPHVSIEAQVSMLQKYATALLILPFPLSSSALDGTEFWLSDDGTTGRKVTFRVNNTCKVLEITAPAPNIIPAGYTFTVNDGTIDRVFEFTKTLAPANGTLLPSGNICVNIFALTTAATVAGQIVAAINGIDSMNATALLPTGSTTVGLFYKILPANMPLVTFSSPNPGFSGSQITYPNNPPLPKIWVGCRPDFVGGQNSLAIAFAINSVGPNLLVSASGATNVVNLTHKIEGPVGNSATYTNPGVPTVLNFKASSNNHFSGNVFGPSGDTCVYIEKNVNLSEFTSNTFGSATVGMLIKGQNNTFDSNVLNGSYSTVFDLTGPSCYGNTVKNHTVPSTIDFGIYVDDWAYGNTISGNTILNTAPSVPISLFDAGGNSLHNLFSGNTISGSAQVGIDLAGQSNNNDFFNNTTTSLTASEVQVLVRENANNNCFGKGDIYGNVTQVGNNTFGKVSPAQTLSNSILWIEGDGNQFVRNNYVNTGLIGWKLSASQIKQLGCIYLESTAQNNLVNEISFPSNTTACQQIIDATCSSNSLYNGLNTLILNCDPSAIAHNTHMAGQFIKHANLKAALDQKHAAHAAWLTNLKIGEEPYGPPTTTWPEYQDMSALGYYQDEYGNWFDAGGNPV